MRAVSNFHNPRVDLPQAAINDIRACFKPRHCVDGEVIYRPGDNTDHIFQISSGNVGIHSSTADGREMIITNHQPGDWFGYVGILDQIPRINTAIALDEVRLLALRSADFIDLCERHPKMLQAFSILLSNHISFLFNLLVDSSLLPLTGRVQRTIQRLLISQGKKDGDGERYIECSQEELGLYVAASRQSTSGEIKKLENAGIVRSTYGKLYVLDTQALDESCAKFTSFEQVTAIYGDDENSKDG
jgi:CRP/FNR family cyclic AMP-dependent transcriptional regulator